MSVLLKDEKSRCLLKQLILRWSLNDGSNLKEKKGKEKKTSITLIKELSKRLSII